MGLDPSHQLTERIIHASQLSEDIGGRWRDLARTLDYNQAVIDAIEIDKGSSTKECCIAVLVRWIGREGLGATVGKLAEALTKIELKSLADKLTLLDTNQNDEFSKSIIDMQTICKHLEEEGSKMRLRIKELEEKLSNATKKYQDGELECSKMRATNLKLEEELASERQQHQNTAQEGSEMRARIKQLEEQLQASDQECSKLQIKILELEEDLASKRQEGGDDGFADATKEGVSDAAKDDLNTDQAARERRISIQLRNLNEKLKINVTSLLQVPEVKEDKLKTAVRLDLLTRLSVSLQDLYSEIVAMAAETCKCTDEDLKREFYDFTYHGLRAEHNDLVHRVKELELSQAEMSDEEKKDFVKLQKCQINRQRQVDRLEKLWRGLFSSPQSLPGATSSDPSGGSGNSEKASGRNNTDPGTKQNQVKSPAASDDDKCEVRLTTPKKSSVKGIFRKKESKNNTCFPVSYTHRDS